ncbi:hypothetical protein BDA99DRAFT_570173 [Phascolomyces articulosus]|uniref:Homeobox domain-containing protein n=2 Tax=Lichtheimiaceae TaxID=499202 RepID=A0AAD5KEZ8_9FUNG|nr:hypothetical protein BDA99DRAFT_570173 [Phascolomyces articulosus]
MIDSCRYIQLPPLHTMMSTNNSNGRNHLSSSFDTMGDKQQQRQMLRVFSPVILFHDHSYSSTSNGSVERIHIPVNDPYYSPLIQRKKNKISEMLESNGKMWADTLRHSPTDTHNEDALSSRSSSPGVYHHQQQQKQHRRRSPSLPLTPGAHEINNHHNTKPSSSNNKDGYFGTMAATVDDSSNSSTTSFSGDEDNHHQQFHQHHHHHHHHQRYCSTTLQDFARQEPSHDLSHHAAVVGSTMGADGSSATANRKRRGNLPKPVTAILKHWLVEHCANPYPTEDEKNWLKHETGLTLNQISNWFINARRRILPLILIKAASADGRPLEHHRKRRGKPPSAMTAARRRMAKRQCQKSSEEETTSVITPLVEELSSATKRGYKRSSSNTAFESPRPTKIFLIRVAGKI